MAKDTGLARQISRIMQKDWGSQQLNEFAAELFAALKPIVDQVSGQIGVSTLSDSAGPDSIFVSRDGATTQKSGDGYSTPTSTQLTRGPHEPYWNQEGGLGHHQVILAQMRPAKVYLGVVTSVGSEYTRCYLIGKSPVVSNQTVSGQDVVTSVGQLILSVYNNPTAYDDVAENVTVLGMTGEEFDVGTPVVVHEFEQYETVTNFRKAPTGLTEPFVNETLKHREYVTIRFCCGEEVEEPPDDGGLPPPPPG